jgi:peptide/nickel transport system substrate-binding protein
MTNARTHRNTLAVAVALAAASLGCERTHERPPPDTLVFSMEQAVLDLDPRFATGNYEEKLSRLVAPGIVSIENDALEPRLLLAERIDRPDPVTYDITLKPDLRFHDGSPLTSADVAYTFQTTIDPAFQSAYRKSFDERIKSIEILDERRIRFVLKRQIAVFITDLEYGIISKRHAEQHKGRFKGGIVVGVGPYFVKSMKTHEVVLERNEHYFGPKPPMRKIIIRNIGDQSARLIALVGESVDAAQNAVRADLIEDVRRKSNLQIVTGKSALLTYVLLQNEDPILQDVRVRRAIAHGIDRRKLIDVKFGGHAVIATGLLHPGHWAHSTEGVATYDFDREAAKRLLDEAGWPDPDGDGPKKRFRISYKTSSDGFRVSLARLIAQQLGDVGIQVDLTAFEFNTFFEDIKAGTYQMATMQTGVIAEADMHFNYFHSSRIPTPKDRNSANRWRYRSAEADRLAEEGRYEIDLEKRKVIYAELQRVIARDLPVIPLWHEDNVAVLNPEVKGFYLLPNARLTSLASVEKVPAAGEPGEPAPRQR